MSTTKNEVSVIRRMKERAKEFARNHADRCGPGYVQHLTRANEVLEGCPQGDFYVWVSKRKKAPKGWTRGFDPALVPPNNTEGSRHRISDATMPGCELWFPPNWGKDENSLKGPMIIVKDNVVITHPTHGFIHIEAGLVCETGYQKNFDLITQQRRRSRD